MAFVANTLSNLPVTSGALYFVDSGARRASDGNAGRDPAIPMATIDAAVARCTANNGDMIVVMPGHDENPTASITMDVDGIWIYGLGWGASRPTVTFGATAATVAMSAASCRISGIRFDLGTVAATVTNCFNITGADCIVEDCEIVPHASSQFTNFMITTADADRFTIRNNRFRGLGATSGTTGLTLVGCDDLNMVDNEISGFFATGAVAQITTAASRVTIARNIITNAGTSYALDLHDNTTGACVDNSLATVVAFASVFDCGNTFAIENYVTDLATGVVSGALVPTTAAS